MDTWPDSQHGLALAGQAFSIPSVGSLAERGLPHKDQYANKFLGHVPYDGSWDYADQRKK